MNKIKFGHRFMTVEPFDRHRFPPSIGSCSAGRSLLQFRGPAGPPAAAPGSPAPRSCSSTKHTDSLAPNFQGSWSSSHQRVVDVQVPSLVPENAIVAIGHGPGP